MRLHPPVLALIGLALGATACGEPSTVHAAGAVFDRFQDCLFAGDRDGLRDLLSAGSQEFLPHLPLERTQDKQRLEVVGADSHPPQVFLQVRDPNEDGAERTFVLVREDGRLVVDLMATTSLNHVERPNPGGTVRVDPRQLTPEEMSRIRSLPPEAIR